MTQEDLSSELFDAEHRRRVGDMVRWVRFHEGMLHNDEKPRLLVLPEFKSTVDRNMAKRMCEYTELLQERLIRNSASESASPPSAQAEQELALSQPQTYRRLDAGARTRTTGSYGSRLVVRPGDMMGNVGAETGTPRGGRRRWSGRRMAAAARRVPAAVGVRRPASFLLQR